jgi:hypothetical protein
MATKPVDRSTRADNAWSHGEPVGSTTRTEAKRQGIELAEWHAGMNKKSTGEIEFGGVDTGRGSKSTLEASYSVQAIELAGVQQEPE